MNIKQQYQAFTGNNPGFNFQTQEITEQLNWGALDKASALTTQQGLQRLYHIYPDIDVAMSLYEKGYRSAHDIAGRPQQLFVADVTPTLEMLTSAGANAKATAQTVWAHARVVSYHTHTLAAAIMPGSTGLAEEQHFERLPKFQEGMPCWQTLFGPSYDTDVPECASIYSPAAYFTDLMRVIASYITASSTDIPAGLSLADRRPDLWQISLDCYSTYHELSYLEIANQVMAAKLASDFQQDTAQYLATHYYPFSLPMNQPLEKIRMYLAHFGYTLADVYQRFQADAIDVARESLLLSVEEAGLITAGTSVSAETMYGLYADENAGDLSMLSFFEEKTGLMPAQVQSLVYQQLRPKQWNGLAFACNSTNYSDGSNTVTVPNSPSLQITGDLTIEFWIYLPEAPPTGGDSYKTPILNKNFMGEFDIEMYNYGNTTDDGSSTIMFFKCGNTSGSNYMHILTGITLNEWCHISVTRKLDSNGVPGCSVYSKYASGNMVSNDYANSFNAPYYPIATTTSTVKIGSEKFNGTFAEIRIWNRALSHEEIDNNMWRSLTGREHGLAAYWPMNDGHGALLGDHSLFANNGTLSEDLVAQWQPVTNFYFGDYEQNPSLQQQLWINRQGSSSLTIVTSLTHTNIGSIIGYSDNSTQWPLLGRFIHLSRGLQWQFADVDWMLNSINAQGLQASDINAIAAVNGLVQQLKQPVDAICALWGDIKTYGMGAAGASQTLFDRVFNTPKAFYNPDGLQDAAAYHPVYAQNPFYHDAPLALDWDYKKNESAGNTGDVDNGLIMNSLTGTLKLKNADLALILNYLSTQNLIPADTLSLTVQNMSLLYRYASLPQWLGLPVEQFLQVLHLLRHPAFDGPENVLKICQWVEWLKKSGLNIYQFQYLCNAPLSAQAAKKIVQPDADKVLQQLAQVAPSVLLTPAMLTGAGLSQNIAESIFNALCDAGFCDTNGVMLAERPVTVAAVSAVLTAALQTSIQTNNPDISTLAASLESTLTSTQITNLELQAENIASHIAGHITDVLQACLDTQTALVIQQLAGAYKIPAQLMTAVASVTERQLPSSPVFGSSQSMQLSIPYSTTINPAQFTLSLWVQFSSLESKQILYNTINGSNGWELLFSPNGPGMELYLPDGTTVTLPGTINAGEWYHMLLSIDTPANGATPYTWSLNGAVTNSSFNSTFTAAISGSTTIGYNSSGNYFGGQLPDIRLYSRYTNDSTAILQEMNSITPSRKMGYVCAWWRLNSRNNTTVHDWSSHGNNGTISSADNNWKWHDFNLRQLLVAAADTDRTQDAYITLQQLTLMASWARWFALSAEEVALIPVNPMPFNITSMRYGFRFNMDQLRSFTTYKTLHAAYRLPATALLEYFNAPAEPIDKTQQLAGAMGWPNDQLYLLEKKFTYGTSPLAFPEDYDNFNTVNGVNSLARCFEISMAMGVNIAFFLQLRQLSALALATGNTSTDNTSWSHYVNAADSLEQAVNAKYTAQEVKAVLQPMQDKIQVLMRDVMSALLIWELGNTIAGIKTQQDLYEYLLIDVRMTNAVQMSVLKAGLNSLQLYVQRCLSNMENGVNCTLPKEWWDWMGSYTEWQANREIYVYPENYVDPTLRKMQSPLFKSLVSEVKQQSATEEGVTKAYLSYLDGLRDIASLHIVDSYARPVPEKIASNPARVIDVFGRTVSSPATFYHRKAIVSSAGTGKVSWTPWENTGLSINSEYLTPVFAFGKMFVFWVEQANESTTKGSNTYPYIRATIYYSFQKAGSSWAPTQVLADDIIIKTYNASGDVNDFYYTFQLNGFNPMSDYEKTKPWNKVTATVLPATDSEDEKILVTLGDMVTWVNDSGTPFQATDTPKTEEQHKVFNYLETLLQTVLPLTGESKVTTAVPAFLLDSGLRAEPQTPLLNLSLSTSYNGFVMESAGTEVLAFLEVTGAEAFAGTTQIDAFIKNTYDNNVYHAWYDQKGIMTGTADSITGPYNNTIICLNFNNNIDTQINLNIPKQLAPINNEFTIGFWAQLRNLSNAQMMLDTSDLTGLMKGVEIGLNNDQFYSTLFEGSVNQSNIYFSTSGFETGKWYYFVLSNSKTTGTFRIYNGQWNVATLGTDGYVVPHNNLRVGYHHPTGDMEYPFDGYITGLQVFNKAITNQAFLDITIGNSSPNAGLKFLPKGRAEVIPVKNQQGWFFLNAGKESFMAIPTDVDYGATKPLISASYGSYLSVTIGAQTSNPPTQIPHYNFIRTSTGVVDELLEKVMSGGISNLLQPSSQLLREPDFNNYVPNTTTVIAPSRAMDFNGAYGLYFWELFFHIPFYIAENLQLNLKFQLSKKWYEYVFDPTAPKLTEQSLVACWPLAMENPKGYMPSIIGRHSGTVVGSLIKSVQDNLPFTDGQRKLTFFNNGAGYVSVPYDAALNTTEFSVSCWLLINEDIPQASGASYASVIDCTAGYTGFKLMLYKWNDDNTTLLSYVYSPGNANSHQAVFSVNLNVWYQVFICCNGTSYTMFIAGSDGSTYQHTQALGGAFAPNTTAPLIFGSQLKGYLANVSYWNSCLNSDQISSLSAINFSSSVAREGSAMMPAKRFWQFVPFRELHHTSVYKELTSTSGQYLLYEYDPFDPDAIASQRPGAYAKGIFMRYISNLIDFGDNLFTQDTWESITEATMYYVLASDLLGPVQRQNGAQKHTAATYNDITSTLSGNVPAFVIDLEATPALPAGATEKLTNQQINALEQRWSIFSAYFGIPANTQLATYRKTIEDRLYKIRHGLNINGQQNNIPLFEPPINPADAAAAAGPGGGGMGGVSAIAPAIPYYRFNYLADIARNFTSEVIRLGEELLAALEKQDGEYLSLLRETQGNAILSMMTQIKQDQVNQLYAEQSNLQASLASAQLEQSTYSRWIADGWNDYEKDQIASMIIGLSLAEIATVMTLISSPMYLIPTIFGLADGGVNFGGSFEADAQTLKGQSEIYNAAAGIFGMYGAFERTNDQWKLQMNLAGNNINAINAQLQANAIAIQSAEQDYNVNQTQIAQSNAVINFLQTKFTNQELYEWMASEVSSVYYQAYQLACGLAQMAQAAYQFELSTSDTYINTSTWSNQYRGLLAGNGLMLSLNQLQQAYVKQNSRSLEISKTISLARLDPAALMSLKVNGTCTFKLTEYLFDTDFPGHYNRKIASIAITIPAIVGPYQNVKATLVQTSNSVITAADANAVAYLLLATPTPPTNGSLRMNWNPGQEIALSTGTSDSGMFQLNYNDERYLPFENTGAVSSWQLTMQKAANQFDFNSINDVIIELKYTAYDGGSTFRQKVLQNDVLQKYSGYQVISLRQQFSESWQQFITTTQTSIELVRKMYPPNLATVNVPSDSVNSPVVLMPILTDNSLLGDITSITLDGVTIPDVATVNNVAVETATVTAGTPLNWALSTEIQSNSALLTKDGSIDGKKWLDVLLIIPYNGTLDWN